MVYDFMLITHF